MRVAVTHTTVYRYDEPVFLTPHVIRLTPRVDGSQKLLSHQLEIAPPPAGQATVLDQDGNVATNAWFQGLTGELAVRNVFEVETFRTNPFDFLFSSPEYQSVPLVYCEPLGGALAHYACGSSVPPGVREIARRTASDAGWQTTTFLTLLTRRLFEEIRQVIRVDGPPYPSDMTLQTGEGACRDVAVLFCDACRAMGLAARFVSGYEHAAATEEHAYMHAWAEVYLPGGGWRGFDPSRGLAAAAGHVPVAAAADPSLAAPISGSYRGSARSEMRLSISMDVGRMNADR